MEDLLEGFDDSKIFHDGRAAGGSNHHQLVPFGGLLLQQLEHYLCQRIRKSRPDRNVLDDPLNLIDDYQRAWRLQASQKPSKWYSSQ